MKPKKVNHLYRDMNPVKGSIAVCGYLKTSNLGFQKSVATCNSCVDVVIGPRKKHYRAKSKP